MLDFFYQYGFIGLFIACFLAATVLPFSSEVVVMLLILNHFDSNTCLWIATAGNVLGGITSFWVGYYVKWSWIEKYFRIKEIRILSVQNRVKKYGSAIAFFTWVPFIGDVIAVALGVLKSNFLTVFIFMFAGKFLRYWLLIFSLS